MVTPQGVITSLGGRALESYVVRLEAFAVERLERQLALFPRFDRAGLGGAFLLTRGRQRERPQPLLQLLLAPTLRLALVEARGRSDALAEGLLGGGLFDLHVHVVAGLV